ncbi:MAG: hypothetical protein KDD69_09120 [Bdellovibrionales bacterium]|nr:hypothetical protein [Bdellovibrionales bacterium]
MISKAEQILLQLQYRERLTSGKSLPTFREVGFSNYSEHDEDGILLYLFAVLGARSRLSIEIGAGNGVHCNTSNLIVHHGWHGALIDASEKNIENGRDFYTTRRETRIYPPQLICRRVTAENVNEIVHECGFPSEIDLLSIDVDGIDFWLWKALECVTPAVVVVEYQDILGPDRSWVMPYIPTFDWQSEHGTENEDFYGASLAAFVKLGRQKGYRLVGCNMYGFNAFFVREELKPSILPELDTRECFTHPKCLDGMRTRFPSVARHNWIRY